MCLYLSFLKPDLLLFSRWLYDSKTMQIKHIESQLCLDLPTKEHPDTLSLSKCSQGGWFSTQKWKLEPEDWQTL